MCGIVALDAVQAGPGEIRRRLTRALATMRDRGPDDAGTSLGDGIGVGMCRLRIRSAAGDTVPFRSANGSEHAYNGEVYSVTTSTGSRLVYGGAPEAEAVWSEADRVDGMWAVATLTGRRGLWIGRDPWGIKPLWVRRGERDTMWASSLTALLTDRAPMAVDPAAVAEFLVGNQPFGRRSYWPDVEEVPPGTGGARAEPGLGVAPDGHPEVAGAAIRSAIHDSVRDVLAADCATGLALSGGLDSTIIAHHVREMQVEQLDTFSVIVEGAADGLPTLDGLRLPGRVPPWRHHITTVGPRDALPLLRRAVTATMQPTALTSAALYLALADLTAEAGVRVLVVGEGADEIWGGYRSYLDVTGTTQAADFYLGQEKLRLLRELVPEQVLGGAVAGLRRQLPSELGPAGVTGAEGRMSLDPLLARTDALLMARSVEGRTPYLHGRGPGLAARLSWAEKVAGGQTKLALRRAYGTVLPAFAHERKQPFRAPWALWMTGDLGVQVEACLRDGAGELTSVGVDSAALGPLLAQARRGESVAANLTHQLCSLVIWLQELRQLSI